MGLESELMTTNEAAELHQVLPSHSRSQLQDLLRELRNEEKIKLVDKTNGAKWYP